MSHVAAEVCAQRLAAGRDDDYRLAAAIAVAIERIERLSTGRQV